MFIKCDFILGLHNLNSYIPIMNRLIVLDRVCTFLIGIVCVLCSGFEAVGSDFPGEYWEDETVFGQNKESGHATYVPYRSVAEVTLVSMPGHGRGRNLHWCSR